MPLNDTPLIVIVPGAFTGDWMWREVRDLLRDREVRTSVVTLPTIGEDGAGAAFADDVRAVRATLDGLDEPATLVGHSYGGAVITAAAAGPHERVRELVYVAAAAPGAGESMASASAAAAERAGGAAGEGGPAPREDGLVVFPREAARQALFNDCTDERAAEALDLLRPQSFAGIDEPIPTPAWTQLPAVYLRATEDLVPRALADGFLDACVDVVDLPTGHCPSWSRPDLVAETLHGRVRAGAA